MVLSMAKIMFEVIALGLEEDLSIVLCKFFFHKGNRSGNSMANQFRACFQFGIGIVHFFVMFCNAR
jgi:hypothetical protein